MKNISFDNPYLLLILIPLLACILVPFIIAIRKENRSKSSTTSLILHLVIALCISLALGGMIYTAVMTKTQVYVVADVSYSANRNLDKVDEYIQQIKDKLPRNSELGVIVFAKDQKVLTEMGEDVVSVKDHGFKATDVAATDITGALNYVANLFDDDVIRRVVLISDGKQTRADGAGELVTAVENLYANDIYIDAIFLDDNLPEDAFEVQISDVEYANATYKGHETSARLLIQSSYATEDAYLTFFKDGQAVHKEGVPLQKGFNVVNFDLPTDTAGRFDYRFTISAGKDTATANNVFEFTQTIAANMNVLLVTGEAADEARAKALYAPDTKMDVYVQKGDKKLDVPCSVEELCKYDEIIISNIDIRDLNNVAAFIDGVDTVVSQFGKSLLTMGDLRIQNKTDNALKDLEDMLPVKYGNNDQDPKLYTIVLDTSRSMQNFSRLLIAKQAAIQLVNMLKEDDYVIIVNFWGDVGMVQPEIKASNRQQIIDAINSVQPKQGTMIASAMEYAEKLIEVTNYSEKQVMLISDGMSFALESDTPADIAKRMREKGIYTSCIHPAGRTDGFENGNPEMLKAIAEAGEGKYFNIMREEDLLEVMFTNVADELTDSVVNIQTPVKVNLKNDPTVAGLAKLPDVMGYAYAKTKASAKTVLTVDFLKSGGTTIAAPLYAYWNYGNGRVATFTSTLTGEWTAGWNDAVGNQFFSNVINENVPSERVDYPYVLDVTFDGTNSQIEIVPVNLNPNAVVNVTVTLPGEEQITEQLIFDSVRYFYSFKTPAIGTYIVDIDYTVEGKTFHAQTTFSISYSPEYNMFEVFDASPLHAAIRNRGTVTEGKIPNLENNSEEVATYVIRFIAPLMILCVVLYVLDIIIRKLRISDIKSFFGIKPKKATGVKNEQT